MKKGCIQVYTGNGKGKTTAAVGLAIRALSHDFKVCYIAFHKNPKRWGIGEQKTLEDLGADLYRFAPDTPFFNKKSSASSLRKDCLDGLKQIETLFKENKYDLMILDEINISLWKNLICPEELTELIKSKPKNLELVLTGRNVPQNVIELADLVTEMREVKHYYSKGISARKGIEW